MASFKIISGSYSDIGSRPTNEDTHVCVDDVSSVCNLTTPTKPVAAYAIFDGHAGPKTATSLEQTFIPSIFAHPEIFTDTQKAIRETVKQIDNKIVTEQLTQFCDRSGSTMASVLIMNHRLFVTNLGDAGVVAPINIHMSTADILYRSDENGSNYECRKGVYGERQISKILTTDQRPLHPFECERITQAGGHIMYGRVSGMLAVSRAFGDYEFKHEYCRTSSDWVSSEPSIAEFSLDPQIDIIVLGCDGLFDFVPQDKIMQMARSLRAGGKNPNEAAKALVDNALCPTDMDQKSSTDNVTCIVLYFDWNN